MSGDTKKTKQLLTQIGFVLIFFALAVYGLWKINLIRFPDFIENIISPDDTESNTYIGDGYEIFEHLSSEDDKTTSSVYPQITVENFFSVLDAAVPYENYYWESSAEITSSSGTSLKECKSRISADRYNVEIIDQNGITVRKCVSNGKNTIITKYNGATSTSGVYSNGLADFYSDASIISVESLKNSNFTDENTEIRLAENESYSLLSLKHSYERNGISVVNNYMISLDYGVVMFAECYENDNIVYKLTTTSIYPLTSLDDELFEIS